MPLPEPTTGETEEEFISRCIPAVIDAEDLDPDSEDDRSQATAMCYDQWRSGSDDDGDTSKRINQDTEVEVRGLLQDKAKRADVIMDLIGEDEMNEDTAAEVVGLLEQDIQATGVIIDLLRVEADEDATLTTEDVKGIVEQMMAGAVTVGLGGSAKAMGDGRVGGYLVRFTGPEEKDLERDYFDKETDYGPHRRSLVFYHHGSDPTLKGRLLDDGAQLEIRDAGVWIETQLDLRDAYERAIYGACQDGKMGWSSGTIPHLIERERVGDGYHIKRWLLGLDASITPIPADPKNVVQPLKSYVDSVDYALVEDDYRPEQTHGEEPREGAGASVAAMQAGAKARVLDITTKLED